MIYLSHDDSVVIVRDGLHDVLQEERRGAQVVHPTGKESLRFLSKIMCIVILFVFGSEYQRS